MRAVKVSKTKPVAAETFSLAINTLKLLNIFDASIMLKYTKVNAFTLSFL